MTRQKKILYALALPALFLGALALVLVLPKAGAMPAPPHAPHTRGYALVCFPQSKWNANPEDRPCDVVGSPYEDGSTYVLQQTANDEVGICYLPNPYEERGHYVAKCHRLPTIHKGDR